MSEDYRFRLAPVDPDPAAVTAVETAARLRLATAEAQADVPLWRYDPDPLDCDHGATVTFRTGVMGDYHVTFDAPLTYCLVCHQLVPDPTTLADPDEFTFTIEPQENAP